MHRCPVDSLLVCVFRDASEEAMLFAEVAVVDSMATVDEGRKCSVSTRIRQHRSYEPRRIERMYAYPTSCKLANRAPRPTCSSTPPDMSMCCTRFRHRYTLPKCYATVLCRSPWSATWPQASSTILETAVARYNCMSKRC